jgi:hypothetical protein
MTEQEPGMEAVDCVEVVYRALKRAVTQDEPIPPEAFIRRIKIKEQVAEDAVSVDRRKYVTARECRSKFNRMRGTASLHAGGVRGLLLGLDLLPDPIRDEASHITDSGHSLLVNLPDPVNDTLAAEIAASELIKIARYVTPEQEEEEHSSRRSG